MQKKSKTRIKRLEKAAVECDKMFSIDKKQIIFRFRSLLLLKETCIIACIGILQEMGETKEHVLLRLKEKFKLSDTDANQYLEKYWKE